MLARESGQRNRLLPPVVCRVSVNFKRHLCDPQLSVTVAPKQALAGIDSTCLHYGITVEFTGPRGTTLTSETARPGATDCYPAIQCHRQFHRYIDLLVSTARRASAANSVTTGMKSSGDHPNSSLVALANCSAMSGI